MVAPFAESAASVRTLDPATEHAVRAFLHRLPATYKLREARVYGSRARGTNRPDSDVDLALVLENSDHERWKTVVELAALAFHVQMDTGVMIEALPLRPEEFDGVSHFPNPALIETIRREGVRM